jgi:hypothetical protein
MWCGVLSIKSGWGISAVDALPVLHSQLPRLRCVFSFFPVFGLIFRALISELEALVHPSCYYAMISIPFLFNWLLMGRSILTAFGSKPDN